MGLKGQAETVHIATDNFELKTPEIACHWYGDPLLEINLNTLFQRKLQGQVLNLLADQQKIKLTDQLQAILTQVLGVSYLVDVPLDIPETPELTKLIKFSGLRISQSLEGNVHGILETLIHTLVELNDRQMVVLTNISHYLQVAQLQELGRVVADTNLSVLIIEFSNFTQSDYFQECDYNYIDSDFVLW